MSANALRYHYDKHHRSYIDNLNKMIAGTEFSALSLEDIIHVSATMPDKASIFNNAAQACNHTLFWQSMRPDGGGRPSARLQAMIEKAFRTFESFKNAFIAAAVGQFGCGSVWLVQDGDTVMITKTTNADTPLANGQNALLTCDMWEHAYYLDYQNRRKDFAQNFVDHLANWEFAAARMT